MKRNDSTDDDLEGQIMFWKEEEEEEEEEDDDDDDDDDEDDEEEDDDDDDDDDDDYDYMESASQDGCNVVEKLLVSSRRMSDP